MSSPNQPPRLAIRLLRACCPAERLEEVEGDLFELFELRCERSGAKYAHRHFLLEVCGICLRQLASRTYRSLVRGWRFRSIVLYPLRSLSALLVGIGLLIPFASDHAWARNLQLVVGCAYAVLEITIYLAATKNVLQSIGGSLRRRRERL